MSVFPNRLRMILEEKRILQKELAAHMGLSDRTINSYVQGKSAPSLEGLAEICTYLNVSADFLIGLVDEVRPLDRAKDEISQDILMIRRSYAEMDEKEQKLIKELVQALVED